MKNFLNGLKSLIIVVALLAGGSTAQAVPGDIYSATFQGLTFTFVEVDANTLSFEIKGTPTPDWDDAVSLDAFGLKDLGINFTTATATANGPGATNLAGTNFELNAGGCSDNGGGPGAICFDVANPVLGTLPFEFDYTIDFSANLNIGSNGPHLKLAFLDDEGNKVGSLYSQNVPQTDTTDGAAPTDTDPTDPVDGASPTDVVPEPSTLFLLGAGLVAMARFARKLK